MAANSNKTSSTILKNILCNLEKTYFSSHSTLLKEQTTFFALKNLWLISTEVGKIPETEEQKLLVDSLLGLKEKEDKTPYKKELTNEMTKVQMP